MKILKVEHRPVFIPNRTLTSPKITNHKIMSEGHCRMCLRPDHVRNLTKHHLVPVSWLLRQPLPLRMIRNAHANIIPVCRPCHDLIDHKEEGERMAARRELRRCLSQQEITFAIQIKSLEWLDEMYPRI